MAALAELLQKVRQGGPAAVLVGGEAGVGKTRLIGEFGAKAREAGARGVAGGCLELGSARRRRGCAVSSRWLKASAPASS